MAYSPDEDLSFNNIFPRMTPEDNLFYGSDKFLPLFRFLYTIYERLLFAHQRVRDKTQADLQRMTEEKKMVDGLAPVEELIKFRQQIVLGVIYGSLNGSDSSTFEDFMRTFLGTSAYILFTIDKTLNLTGREVMRITNEDFNNRAIRLQRITYNR